MEFQVIEKMLSEQQALLALKGRLDAISAPELKTRLKHLAEDKHIHLVLDMTAISFIDSSGLAALVSGLKVVRESGGSLKLAGLNEQTRTVIMLTRLDRVFELYPTPTDAIHALSGTK